MRTRTLGRDGPELSVIGFGAWALGGGGWAFGWGPQDDRESIAAIHRALDLGVNWIDTAAVYGLGHSEEVVGRAVRDRRDRVFIATKCGLVWNEKGRIQGRTGAQSVRREVEASLRRLGTDRIDLYQIHWPTKKKDDLEAWEEMGRLMEEGKIRYAGVSNFDVKGLQRLSEIRRPQSLQPPYSMLERGVEGEILPWCEAHGIGVIAYSPMQCGLLSGKMTRARRDRLPEDDFRRRDRHFQEPAFSATLELVEGLRRLAAEADRTPAQLALAWVLRRPTVTAAITGTRHPAQIEETAAAAEWEPGRELEEAVETLLERRRKQLEGKG